jgi:hypothetical protein
MKNLGQAWLWAIIVVLLALGGYLYYEQKAEARLQAPPPVFKQKPRAHLDHAAYFTKKFARPQDVTRACLECHPHAARDFMKTAHWQWLGPEEKIPGRAEPIRMGKPVPSAMLAMAGIKRTTTFRVQKMSTVWFATTGAILLSKALPAFPLRGLICWWPPKALDIPRGKTAAPAIIMEAEAWR